MHFPFAGGLISNLWTTANDTIPKIKDPPYAKPICPQQSFRKTDLPASE